jgi:hypothetical protein
LVLSEIDSNGSWDVSVPILIEIIEDSDRFNDLERCYDEREQLRNVLIGLSRFGGNAKQAVPALLKVITTYDETNHSVLKALKAIDPEAAKKAGVK